MKIETRGVQCWRNGYRGLIYMNARYYNCYLNRFVSADTLVPDTQNPQSFNRYAYVLGNPLMFRDPSGHCAEFGDDSCWSAYDRFYAYIHANPDVHLTEGSPWLAQEVWGATGTRSEEELVAMLDTLHAMDNPERATWRDSLASMSSDVAMRADDAAFFIGGFEAIVANLGYAVLGASFGAYAGPPRAAFGLEAGLAFDIYMASEASPLGRVANVLGYVSAGANFVSDVSAGKFVLDPANGRLGVGQDTVVSLVHMQLGRIPELNWDAVVNYSQVAYNHGSHP